VTAFDKPATTPSEQLDKLRQRGLIIDDEPRVLRYLSNISYFRLSAYTRPFYVPDEKPHRFLPGTTFDNVLTLYIFDRKLRLLLLEAIERLEVALRAQLTNALAEHYGPHGYLDPGIFDTRYNHSWLLEKMDKLVQERNVEVFLHHYRSQYASAPSQPPVWMVTELLTFKEVSILLANLRHEKDTQRIERHFGWKFRVLKSWFRSLSDLRNLCAHHMRIWNREFGSRPEMPVRRPANWPNIPVAIPTGSQLHPEQTLNPQSRLYMQVVVIESLMRIVSPRSSWSQRFVCLLDQHKNISRPHMGFPSNWEEELFWLDIVSKARSRS
jgi:abortive infection bacteriophage resistance protein